jgi:zinc protease
MEMDNERGVSHFLEHMIFNGSRDHPSQDALNQAIQSIGGRDNAGTSREQTSYFINCPSENWKEALAILTDMVNRPVLDQGEFEREREVVLEEIRLAKDNHTGWLFHEMMRKAFEHHVYQHPVLGYEETLQGLTVDNMRDYHSRFYVPNNMFLVAAGDFDAEEMMSETRSLWNDISSRDVTIPDTWKEDPQNDTREIFIPRDVESVYFQFFFKGPSLLNEDFPALHVLMTALGDGESSRLVKRLKNEKTLVSQVGSTLYGMNDSAIIGFGGRTDDPDKLDDIARESTDVLNGFLEDGISREELEKAKRIAHADRVFQAETTIGMTSETGYLATSGGVEFPFLFEQKLEDVTAGDVNSAARRYLSADRLTIGAVIPSGAKPPNVSMKKLQRHGSDAEQPDSQLSSIDMERLDALMQETIATPAEGARGSGLLWSTKLENGLQVVIKENPKNPVVAISILTRGGLSLEPQGKNGVAELTQNLLVKGTSNRTAEQIALEVEEMGGSIATSVQSEYCTLGGSFLSEDFEKGMDILADIVVNSTFPENELDKSRSRQLARIKSNQDDPYARTRLLFKKALFGDEHPFGNPIIGAADTVPGLTRDDVREYYRAEFDPGRMVIAISGDVSRSRLMTEVERLLEPLPYRGGVSGPIPVNPPVDQPVTVDDPVEREQVLLMLGNMGPGYDSDDLPAFQVMNTVFGGGSHSRLFTRLRGEEGLAYSVYSSSSTGSGQGYYLAHIGTSPGTREQALQGILREMELMKQDVTEEEVQRAIISIISGHKLALQSNAALAANFGGHSVLGMPPDFDEQLLARIREVTSEDVMEMATKYLDTENYVLVRGGQLDAEQVRRMEGE